MCLSYDHLNLIIRSLSVFFNRKDKVVSDVSITLHIPATLYLAHTKFFLTFVKIDNEI